MTTRYAYTKGGRLARLSYPDGGVADYARDSLGRISAVGVTRPGQARQVVVTNVTYAPFGPATGWTYGNGRQLQRPVDTDYRPQAVHDGAAGGLSLSYGYDPVGNITELKTGSGATVLARYGYDALRRLTQTQDGPTSTPIETYAYDATGNRVSLTTANGTATYAYPADSHRLLAVDGESRNYDAAGNTLNIGGKAYSYNDANRMSQVEQGDAVLESYTYNHGGERVLRVPSTGSAQLAMYDEDGLWLGSFDAAGGPLQQAVWLGSYPVALLGEPPFGVPELAYVQPDHLGTPRVVFDSARTVAIWQWTNQGEVFGDQIPSSDPDGDGVELDLALRFPGQRVDLLSGLSYNYFRDYDPMTGRYVQSDPIGLNAGPSTYAYVSGNPLIFTDRSGLACDQRGCWVTPTEQAYADVGNYGLYYQAACSGGDPYACRAREVAMNQGLLAAITNTRLGNSILEGIQGLSCEAANEEMYDRMDAIRVDLARAHAKALSAAGATPDRPVRLDRWTDIGRFHEQVFKRHGAGEVFGGRTYDKLFGRGGFGYDWCPSPSCK